MTEWKPIETAPRDGSWLLLKGGNHGIWRDDDEVEQAPVVCAFYNGKNEYWCDDANDMVDYEVWAYCFWDSGWRSVYVNPTHWMPLPEPPQD
jgi:hypothetical protein